MIDTVTPERRSEIMGKVLSKNTAPELFVRRLLYAAGYRYRLHYSKLPGKPDIVFPGRQKAVFVHGCFWHRHANCSLARIPKSRVGFWTKKLEANAIRDQNNLQALREHGWEVCVVWECELKDTDQLLLRLREFLD